MKRIDDMTREELIVHAKRLNSMIHTLQETIKKMTGKMETLRGIIRELYPITK